MTVTFPEKTRIGPSAALSLSVAVPQKVFKRRDYPIFATLSLLNFAAIANLGRHWFVSQDWHSEPLILLAVTLLLGAVLAIQQSRWFLLPLMRKPLPIPIRRQWRVGVATTFVPGAEPLDMLDKTVAALVALDYPHETWVLDEGDDDLVKAICLRRGALHFSRQRLPRYQVASGTFARRSKHGNYNAWLSEIAGDRYDIVAAFDPDHVPEPNFLECVLGYFEDPRVGYVQVAQAFSNQAQSWIARGAAEETYEYFSTIQMASYGLGYPILVGGHNTHRIAALRAVGGFAAHDADDILTTLHYRDAGWRGVYVPQILARGLNPTDWGAYLAQQRRWARSVLDLKLRAYPSLSGKTPASTRVISFLHGLNYLLSGLWPAVALGLLCVMCATGSALQALSSGLIVPLGMMVGALGLSELYRRRFFLAPCSEGGIHWRAAVLRWAKWPQMLLALQDVLLNRQPAYTITAKSKGRSTATRWLWPHVIVAILLAACWIIGVTLGNAALQLWHFLVAIVVLATAGLWITDRNGSNAARAQQNHGRPSDNG